MRMMLIDKLVSQIIKLKSPIVVGLDPVLEKIPAVYWQPYTAEKNEFKKISNILFDFNKDIIDTVAPYVPAVKPQTAFYEVYGSEGIRALEKTIEYAKGKGLIVIEDGKRNDIGNTALAYANAHLGMVKTTTDKMQESFGVDFLTISPYLGKESLEPFVEVCKNYDKGVFILVKTSNSGNKDVQDTVNKDGILTHQVIAKFVEEFSKNFKGECGYSSIGAVVGATYPNEAEILRKMMPHNYFLVPGYGVQGGTSKDIVPCFNPDGLGAIINSSRAIIYSYEKVKDITCSKEEYKDCVKTSIINMRTDIYNMLKETYPNMLY
jgi:orotidine-5'-phosphate decarboxylase